MELVEGWIEEAGRTVGRGQPPQHQQAGNDRVDVQLPRQQLDLVIVAAQVLPNRRGMHRLSGGALDAGRWRVP